jgi:serine/threonine-protein kinase
LDRFNRETDLAATNIVGVHDRGEFNRQPWISMNYAAGADAAQLMPTRYPAGMPERDVSAIVTAVAGALDYADQCGLSHREVKPSNLLLTHPRDGSDRTETADLPDRQDEFRRSMAHARVGKMP